MVQTVHVQVISCSPDFAHTGSPPPIASLCSWPEIKTSALCEARETYHSVVVPWESSRNRWAWRDTAATQYRALSREQCTDSDLVPGYTESSYIWCAWNHLGQKFYWTHLFIDMGHFFLLLEKVQLCPVSVQLDHRHTLNYSSLPIRYSIKKYIYHQY